MKLQLYVMGSSISQAFLRALGTVVLMGPTAIDPCRVCQKSLVLFSVALGLIPIITLQAVKGHPEKCCGAYLLGVRNLLVSCRSLL